MRSLKQNKLLKIRKEKLMSKLDIIAERIAIGVCPICNDVKLEYQIVEDKKYGKVKICKNHHVDGSDVYNLGGKENADN